MRSSSLMYSGLELKCCSTRFDRFFVSCGGYGSASNPASSGNYDLIIVVGLSTIYIIKLFSGHQCFNGLFIRSCRFGCFNRMC
jgi:hypothetical protein